MTPTIDDSFLANYRLPRLSFDVTSQLPDVLEPVWTALHESKIRLALRRGYILLRNGELTGSTRAGLLAALASAELDNGVVEAARELAYGSLELVPRQWTARRVLLNSLLVEKDFEAARRHLDDLIPADELEVWDEPLSDTEQHLIMAVCSWMTNDWDGTARQLTSAYPEGVCSMPGILQEDWLRLAFYRERPNDAAAAALKLIEEGPVERADVILQTLVRQGWHAEALTLYRSIFDRDPTNELLRRRIVGLCIREGHVQEARRLMELGALRLAV